MILLDTSVLSEAMKPEPDAIVLGWLDAQAAESLYITSISVAELLAGIGVLPNGPSKDGLARALDRTLQMFSGQMLTFESLAAWTYADLAVKAIKRGKSYATSDMYIAAIAAAHGLPVASRSAPIFESLGVIAIDPWQA